MDDSVCSATGTAVVCRLCAGQLLDGVHVDIFSAEGIAAKVGELIRQHYGIEVLICDGLSTFVCLSCWTITDQFHKLYELVRANDPPTVRFTASNTSNDRKPFVSVHETCTEAVASSTNETMLVDTDDRLDAHQQFEVIIAQANDECYVLDDGTKLLAPVELDDSIVYDDSLLDDALLVKAETMPAFDDQLTASDDLTESAVEPMDEQPSGDESPGHADDGSCTGDDERDLKRSAGPQRCERQRTVDLALQRENKLIREYFSMRCDLCETKFETLYDASKHYRECHQQAGYLTCCGRRIYRRGIALEHIRKHMNPDMHRCDMCDKVYTNNTTLQAHMRRHMPIADQMLTCEQCGEMFLTANMLGRHKAHEHNDVDKREFGCENCGKFFVSKNVLTNHVRGVHENAFAHMCHICAKTFKSKQVFELHQRKHLDVEPPKLQCTICGNWLKHEHSLRKHMDRHKQSEEVCKLCNKVAPNRHALSNHMRYVHSERSHKCTMCDKAFKKPIGLKEHMASHMGVDLYRCPYCPKTFKSNANMHSHRKKKHLPQWLHDREQRQRP